MRCHPKAWRVHPPLPINPLHGVKGRSLEASLRATLERINSSQATLWNVSCASMPSCVVTWRGPRQPGARAYVRYQISRMNVRGSHGCWIAAHHVVLRLSDAALTRALEGWGNAFTQPSGCTSWPKH